MSHGNASATTRAARGRGRLAPSPAKVDQKLRGPSPPGPPEHNLLHTVARVFSFNLLAQVLLAIVGILLIGFMGHEEYALFTFASSLVAAASLTLSASFNRIYIAGHSELALKEYTPEFLGLQLLTVAVAGVVLLPWLPSLGALYGLVIAMVAAQCLAEYAQTVFQQELRFSRYSLIVLLRSVALLVSVVLLTQFVGVGLKAWHVFLLQSITLSMIFVGAVGTRIPLARVVALPQAMQLARTMLHGQYVYLFGYFAVLALSGQIDVWAVRAFHDDLAVATYGTAFRYCSLLLLALNAIHIVLLPHIQEAGDFKELDAILRRMRKIVAAFLALVLAAIALAPWIIPWIDHGRYPQAVPVFRILAVMAAISFAFSPYVNVLLRLGDYRLLFLTIMILASLHVILCTCLTLSLGICGTATATSIYYSTFNLLTFLRARSLRGRILPPGAARCGC